MILFDPVRNPGSFFGGLEKGFGVILLDLVRKPGSFLGGLRKAFY